MLAPDEINAGPAPMEVPPPLPLAVDRRAVLLEMAVVLSLAVLPYLFYALVYFSGVKIARPGFAFDMLHLAIASLQIAVPLLYILWRSGTPLATFGLLRPRWLADAGMAVFLFCGVWVANNIAWQVGYSLFGQALLAGSAQSEIFSRPQTTGDYLAFAIAMTVNAFAEELAMRGYLITRLQQLRVPPLLIIALSAGLFGAYHLYQGVWNSLLITLCGLLFAIAFLVLGRLWPLVVAHLLLDIVAFLNV